MKPNGCHNCGNHAWDCNSIDGICMSKAGLPCTPDNRAAWIPITVVVAAPKDMYMEDVHDVGLRAMKEVTNGLKAFGIELTDVQEDAIYVPIVAYLEQFSNGDYRSYN